MKSEYSGCKLCGEVFTPNYDNSFNLFYCSECGLTVPPNERWKSIYDDDDDKSNEFVGV